MRLYSPNGSTREIDATYVQQDGDVILDHFPPKPGEAPAYDTWEAAQATAQTNAALVAQAQCALDRSDITYLRTQEDEIPWPPSWIAYRKNLRAIVKGGAGPLPTIPALYPDGTATA
jgi:hypothetical protein